LRRKAITKNLSTAQAVAKCPVGIVGFDQITNGGLPRGRPALVCGGAGCGKTLFAVEFVVRGATQFNEPGVFVSFEESGEELAANVRSMGFDLNHLVRRKMLAMDFIRIERSEIEETGSYDLDGLFVRLQFAIDSIKAKRVVLDTIEALFAGLSDTAILRAELRRLFRWLKDQGVTALITGERGEATLTRQGIEEYVSDCVIVLDHRIQEQLSTRRLRVVKYRGSAHGTNEYPFIIDKDGITVLPVTSVGLNHRASTARISSGIERLDTMLEGRGYYRGSSIMVSGSAGTGKTTLGCSFVHSACGRGERCLYFAFEESPSQIVRNMRSIGIELQPWIDKSLLQFHAARPTLYGLETHLSVMHRQIEAFKPAVIVVDPVTTMLTEGAAHDVRSMLLRLMDHMKSLQITAFLVSLNHTSSPVEQSEAEISSLIDTWLLVRDLEYAGERNRGLYILKSRGMAHSNQIREFVLGRRGVQLLDVYLVPAGMLTGSARVIQETKDRAQANANEQEFNRVQAQIAAKRSALEAQIGALQSKIKVQDQRIDQLLLDRHAQELTGQMERRALALSRRADVDPAGPGRGRVK
jgi:circadian clock protein KaiC